MLRAKVARTSLLLVVTGVLVTAALSIGAEESYSHNQRRLTTLQTSLTASALGVAPLDYQRRLGEVADAVASSTDPTGTFRHLITPSMSPAGPFASSSLVSMTRNGPELLAHLGTRAIRKFATEATTELYLRAVRSGQLVTTRIVGRGVQKLGFLESSTGPRGTFVVAGAETLPVPDVLTIPASSPDTGLNVALYFGSTVSPDDLIARTRVPPSPSARAVVPFGTSTLTLVASARTALAGSVSETLPWTIAAAGFAFTILLAALVEHLVRRQRRAQVLAAENARLFRQQRDVAVTLQRALLPPGFPTLRGVDFAARYLPGVRGTEVGGDWYSVFCAGEGRTYFVVGDISGHGIKEAALMAQVRFTIRTLALLGYDPASILRLASEDFDYSMNGHFATVLVGLIEDFQRLTLASAGQLPPLLLDGNRADFVEPDVGAPLGLGLFDYESLTIDLPAAGTLLAFTDGLVETRSASLDDGLQHLRLVVKSHFGSALDDLVSAVMSEQVKSPEDDTVLLGISWDRTLAGNNPPGAREPATSEDRPLVRLAEEDWGT